MNSNTLIFLKGIYSEAEPVSLALRRERAGLNEAVMAALWADIV